MVPAEAPTPPYMARGWRADLRFFEVDSSLDLAAQYEEAKRHHHLVTHLVGRRRKTRGRTKVIFAPEIVIEALDRPAAQRAANLMAASKVLLDGDFASGEAFIAVPDDPTNLEDLDSDGYDEAIGTATLTTWLARAAYVAARATHRRRWSSAMIKHWLSHRTCSVPWIEHHPVYGDRFTTERDPTIRAMMA
jgi:hypothetical protein